MAPAIGSLRCRMPTDTASARLSPEQVTEILERDGGRSVRTHPLDRLLGRWISVIRRHLVAAHVLVALLLALLADRGVSATLGQHPSLPERLGIELAIVLAAVSVPVVLTLGALRSQFRQIFNLVSDAPGASASVMLRFVSEELHDLERRLDTLRLHGIRLAPTELSDWVRPRCFGATRGRYIAADVCSPSVFMRNYRGYLDAHSTYIETTGQRTTVRVNLCDEDELEHDATAHADAYRSYVRWHDDNEVLLLHLPPRRAASLANDAGLGSTPIDAALWLNELVIRTEFESAETLRVTIGLVDDPLYRGVCAYLQAVLREAEPFPRR